MSDHEQKKIVLPCPFCGGSDLQRSIWVDESGEYDAIECAFCLGAAPARIWNARATTEQKLVCFLPTTICEH